MPKTPIFAFRLGKSDQEKLEEMARLFGSPNPSAFAREMVTAICSGDQFRLAAFQGRLQEKLTGQLQLEFQQRVEAGIKEARQQASKRRKPSKRVKGGKHAKRPT